MDATPDRSRPRWRVILEYGPLEAVLGYAFFYYLVGLATPVFRDAVAAAGIGIDPALIPFAAALALWAIFLLTLLGQAIEQVGSNPHRFEDGDDERTYWNAITPTLDRVQLWGLLATVGVAVAVLGFDAFIESFLALVGSTVIVMGGTVPVSEVGRHLPVVILYTIGFSLFTRYTDRVAIGLFRRWRLTVLLSD